jgi:hypothetical protein
MRVSLDVGGILWRLNRARIEVPARCSALPRFRRFYLTTRPTNSISSDNLLAKPVDVLSGDGSTSLNLNATGGVCIEVALIGALSSAIAVILILAVGNLSACNAPT